MYVRSHVTGISILSSRIVVFRPEVTTWHSHDGMTFAALANPNLGDRSVVYVVCFQHAHDTFNVSERCLAGLAVTSALALTLQIPHIKHRTSCLAEPTLLIAGLAAVAKLIQSYWATSSVKIGLGEGTST